MEQVTRIVTGGGECQRCVLAYAFMLLMTGLRPVKEVVPSDALKMMASAGDDSDLVVGMALAMADIALDYAEQRVAAAIGAEGRA